MQQQRIVVEKLRVRYQYRWRGFFGDIIIILYWKCENMVTSKWDAEKVGKKMSNFSFTLKILPEIWSGSSTLNTDEKMY